jgi:hypothetical protein
VTPFQPGWKKEDKKLTRSKETKYAGRRRRKGRKEETWHIE